MNTFVEAFLRVAQVFFLVYLLVYATYLFLSVVVGA